jgi:alpha-tubulin suppressor-like RCC1 family protein
MNISQLQILLQESIDRATSTMEYLELSKAIQALNMGQIRKVADLENLPSASTNEGLLVFVESEETLYWSTGSNWEIITRTNTFRAYSWGFNTNGRLGDGTITTRTSPVSIVGGFTDWHQIDAGLGHVAGVRQDGTLWSWGVNTNGRLGDGTTISRSSPISVVGGFTDWCQVSAGGFHSHGLRSNGTLWAWGVNSAGQLGDGTLIDRSSPVSVVGGFTDWCQISTGINHNLAVRSNGTLWAWGFNTSGQLGDGTVTTVESPVSVVGGFTDWCFAGTGNCHSLAVRTNGTLWAWGLNNCGQLGNNSIINRSSPVSVVGGFTNWCFVNGTGSNTSLGIRSDGCMWTWGESVNNAFGTTSQTTRSSPVSVVGTGWCHASLGLANHFALKQDGTLWGWGVNISGTLGDGTSSARTTPVLIVGGFTDWYQVSAGACNATALRSQGFE